MLRFIGPRQLSQFIPMTCVAAITFGLSAVGAGDEPPRGKADESRAVLDRFARGYQLYLGKDEVPLEMQPEPVLRWPNARRDTLEGATFVWVRDGRPEAIGCIWENGGYWANAFHSLSDSKVVGKHNTRTFWQTDKPGVEFNKFVDAAQPADSAAKRLTQMKALARRIECRLPEPNKRSEELRLLPQPFYRYKTEREDLIDGALFAFVQGTDPEAVVVLEAVRRDGKSEWRYGITRRTAHAVEADLDGKPVWSVPLSNGASNEAWFVGGLGKLN